MKWVAWILRRVKLRHVESIQFHSILSTWEKERNDKALLYRHSVGPLMTRRQGVEPSVAGIIVYLYHFVGLSSPLRPNNLSFFPVDTDFSLQSVIYQKYLLIRSWWQPGIRTPQVAAPQEADNMIAPCVPCDDKAANMTDPASVYTSQRLTHEQQVYHHFYFCFFSKSYYMLLYRCSICP